MRRRDLLQLLGAAAATSVAWPLRPNAQQRSQPVVVGIFTTTNLAGKTFIPAEYDAFYQAMGDLGYVEGKNISYAHSARNQAEPPPPSSRPALALELVRQKPEVIVTSGGEPAVRALMVATSTIPIVMVTTSDAVEAGLVTSLAHPGGQVTGLSWQSIELSTKRLQLLHQTLPLVRRIAVFWDPTTSQSERDATDAAGRALGIELQFVEISAADQFDRAFETAANWGAEALFTGAGRIVSPNREKFVAVAARYRLPAMYHQSVIVLAGGLMSYGPNFPDLWRRAATYVDKILKGTKPGDLPVQQPTRFELVINLKTAKALGLTMPTPLLDLADEVIE
jgi:putative tryptophan/tyrosine transport system substrate-binding protein